jgi:hypothetical protein
MYRTASSSACQHDTIAVAVNELCRNVELQQTRKGLARHRAWKHVAADDDLVHAGLLNLTEDRLERRQVTVNVVESRDPHRDPSLPAPTAGCRRPRRSAPGAVG